MALRVTRQQIDVAGSPAVSTLRVTRQSILVLYTKAVSSFDLTASNALSVQQAAHRTKARADATELDAEDTLNLDQDLVRVHVLDAGFSLTADDTLNLQQRANEPILVTASSPLSFTQSTLREVNKSGESTLSLVQTVTFNRTLSLSGANQLGLIQTFTFESNRLSDKHYSPQVGSGADPIETTPPVLNRQEDIQLFYPPLGPQAHQLSIRSPEFGNLDRNAYSRVNRESRGGSLRVFSDPKWPKTRTLVLNFVGLKKELAESLLDFFHSTLGLRVGLRDWENRVWHGIILNPDSAIIQNKRSGVDVSVEMVVELSSSKNQFSVLELSHMVSVEVN